ncbi:MAG: FAD binding domain-containing protein [Candidatus Eremiobacteraeota bacterium]|nr:FAD binding domain-containing protein [Candidatus Eremiobacteraeota bacterium]
MQYFEPNFVDEALVLLDRFAPHAHVLAGGTLLGPKLRDASSDETTIVNVKRIPQLREIDFDGRTLTIGALATARELASDDLVLAHAPLVARAAASIGAVQLRTSATIGGNLCSGHRSADLATALLASDAICLLSDIAAGPTRMSISDFLKLSPAAFDRRVLLTGVVIPASAGSIAYHKMQTRRAFEMAIVAAAVSVEVARGAIGAVRIALGGAARRPIRAANAEQWAQAKPPDAKSARAAAEIAAQRDAAPVSDLHASAEYRRQLVAVLVERALREAFARPRNA